MNARQSRIVGFFIAVFFIACVREAIAACTPIPSGGFTTPSANTTYCLTGDIASGGITVNKSNIVIDGQGHSLVHGSIAFSTVAMDNVTIQNITLQNGRLVFGDAQNDVSCSGGVCTAHYFTTNVTIQNSTFMTNGQMYSPYIQTSVLKNFTFRNNTVKFLGSVGNMLQMHWTTDSLIENNVFMQTVAVSSQTEESFGILFRDASSRITFRNNVIVNNGKSCMMLSGSGTGMSLAGNACPHAYGCDNVVENNVLIGLPNSLSVSRTAVIERQAAGGGDIVQNNIFYGVSLDALAAESGQSNPGGSIDHNTIVNTSGSKALMQLNGTSSSSFTNNIIYGTADSMMDSTSTNNYIGTSAGFGAFPDLSAYNDSSDAVDIAEQVKTALHSSLGGKGVDFSLFGTSGTPTPTPAPTATPPSMSVDTTPPRAPSNFRPMILADTYFRLLWIPSDDPSQDMDHYNLYRAEGASGGSFTVVQQPPRSITNKDGSMSYNFSVIDSGLKSSTTYRYYLVATDAAGNESAQAIVPAYRGGGTVLSVTTLASGSAVTFLETIDPATGNSTPTSPMVSGGCGTMNGNGGMLGCFVLLLSIVAVIRRGRRDLRAN